MNIIKVFAVLCVTALISILLKAQNNGFHRLIGVTGTVIAGVIAINSISPILEYANGINDTSAEILQILVRTLGISYLTDLAASLCRDSGETSLAFGVEICGKAEMLLISFPMFVKLFDICTAILS